MFRSYRNLKANHRTYHFIGTCVDNPFEDAEKLGEIIDNGQEISKEAFSTWCEIPKELEEEMELHPDDYTFYRNVEEDIFFYAWSNIEHFYK